MEMPKTAREFDITDPKKTRLIWKNPVTGHSYWRTEEGDYIELTLSNLVEVPPEVIDTTSAHEMMNGRERAYTWYITQDETKELQEDDKRIERKRSLGL
jgi:hypothetical protein